MTDLIERLRPFVARKAFREFVRRGVKDWCVWNSEHTEKVSELQLVPENETAEDTQRRFPQIDALESNLNYRLVAVADDERLTIPSKCTLVALYWYRKNRQSRTLCPTSEPLALRKDISPFEPFELVLLIGDGREPSRFDAIDITTEDVITSFEQHHAVGGKTGVSDEAPSVAASKRVRAARWLAEAMLLVRDNPEWSDAEIARQVGKNKSTLSRNPVYQTAAAMARSDRGTIDDIPRGHFVRSEDGFVDLEAGSSKDNPAEMDWD